MSYSFRNRPKLSDRYRGKSGDEILNELKNQIDEDRKMFFESSPSSWNSSVQSPGSFSRGNPLDDMMSRGRQDIRSHLDDLAQRHPEFADHLRCPPWGGEMGSSSRGTWGRKRRGSGSSGDDSSGACNESPSPGPQPSEEASPSRGRPRQSNLPQYGLRNTVDLGQQQQGDGDEDKGRGQRSWSAPPDNRTQNPPDPPRYVSRLDIPVMSQPAGVGADQGKPPVAPKQQPQQYHTQQQQQPQQPPPQQSSNTRQSQQGSTVRHIPIFVEGRDEPLLPKAADSPTERVFTERAPPPSQSTFSYGRPSQFTARAAQQQSTPQMPQSTPFAQSTGPAKAKPFMQQQQAPPTHHPTPPPTESHTKQESSQQHEPSQPKPPPQPKQPPANDPISRVQAVQKDVDELQVKVENFKGISGRDKEYMYLDEMLTRNLLKLDNVETEGRDDVRQARKAVIRNIQKCISILESKIPSSEEVSKSGAEEAEKLSSNPSDEPAKGDSVVPADSEANRGEETVTPNQQEGICADSNLEMDAQNSLSCEGSAVGPKQVQVAPSPELAMDTEPTQAGKLDGEAPDLSKKKPDATRKKKGSEGKQLKDTKAGLPPGQQEQQNSESVKKCEGPENEVHGSHQEAPMLVDEGNNKPEPPQPVTPMQVEESNEKVEPSQKQMEVDDSSSKENLSVPPNNESVRDEKSTESPKGDGSSTVSNKTSKSKSPKGSPKKGKRTT